MPSVPSQLWTRTAAAAADRHSLETLGIPSPVLMERAALACVAAVERVRVGRAVVVLCGPGNNGGDGVAIGRILHDRGVSVRVHLLDPRHSPALAQQVAVARAVGVPLVSGVPTEAATSGVVVDAILGTGARLPLTGDHAAAVVWANAAASTRVAVDVPTGIDADTGTVPGPAFAATATVTFQRSKPGLHLTPGRNYVGTLTVADIGLHPAPESGVGVSLIDPVAVAECLASLPSGRHKGERGHVAVVGGSAGTPGAALLAGVTALRAGAGLVTLVSASPELQAELLRHRPELMWSALGPPWAPSAGVLVVGPGLTAAAERGDLPKLYAEDPRPAVWDASALLEINHKVPAGPRVITPHPAEAARLLSQRTNAAWTTATVQADRAQAAQTLAASTGAVVVLKGEGSVVATGSSLAIAVSGGPALATAGTGDCLAGLIAALLARGVPAIEAACAGVHVHGVAGEWLGAERPGAVAMELAEAVARVLATRPQRHPRWPLLYCG